MINILFKKRADEFYFFEIKGHANMSSYGTDIVCASVSSTSLLTMNALIEVLKLDFEYIIDDAYILCNLEKVEDKSYINFLKAFYLFIEEMAKQYPKNLKFKVMEV